MFMSKKADFMACVCKDKVGHHDSESSGRIGSEEPEIKSWMGRRRLLLLLPVKRNATQNSTQQILPMKIRRQGAGEVGTAGQLILRRRCYRRRSAELVSCEANHVLIEGARAFVERAGWWGMVVLTGGDSDCARPSSSSKSLGPYLSGATRSWGIEARQCHHLRHLHCLIVARWCRALYNNVVLKPSRMVTARSPLFWPLRVWCASRFNCLREYCHRQNAQMTWATFSEKK
jgi:hypothetical protein